jgi:ribonuclease P/MRP protein subunit POP7
MATPTSPTAPTGSLKRKAPSNPDPSFQKRAKLPSGYKPSRRPLLRAAIPSPFAAAYAPKVVYMKHSTPFIPTIKRVRGLLRQIERREYQSLSAGRKPLDARTVEAAIANAGENKRGGPKEAVYVKATGRAIEKALGVGLYFQEEGGFGVRIETGTMQAVDDVVEERKGGFLGGWVERKLGGSPGNVEDMEVDEVGGEVVTAVVEVPETRMRALNTITVAITLR